MLAGLAYAEQRARQGCDVMLTVGSVTTLRDLQQPACGPNSAHDALRRRNIEKLQQITQAGQGTVVLRAPTNAVPLRLLTQAEEAAPCKDLRIQVI